MDWFRDRRERGRPRHPDVLTPAEWRVLEHLREGLSNPEIADRLGLSINTVRTHVASMLAKLDMPDRHALAEWTGRPATESTASRRLAALLPLDWIRTATTSAVAPAKALALTGVSIAGVAAVVIAMQAARGDAASMSGGLVAPDPLIGRVAYVHDGDLWIRDVPDGTPRRLVSDGAASNPRWSPSGEWILADRTVVAIDGSNQRDGTGCLAWSPAADQLACVVDAGALRIEDADGSRGKQFDVAGLVPGIDDVLRLIPFWGPDGSTVGWVIEAQSTDPGTPAGRYNGLWIANPDGTGARELISNRTYPEAGQLLFVDWRDDELLVHFNPSFSASILSDGLALHVVSESGGPPRLLHDTTLIREELFGGFSTTGLVALTDGGWRETWTNKRIAVVDPATGMSGVLTNSEQAALSPAWSPDGERIAYVAGPDIGRVGGGEEARLGAAQRRIWIMDADGAGATQLTAESDYRDERPLWAGEGEHILFARLNGDDQASLWLVSASGDAPVQVADISWPVEAGGARWFGFYGYIAWDAYFDWWSPEG